MNRDNIDKIAQNPEDRLFLAKVWDKINAGIRRSIPACTCFLSPREQQMCRFLFGDSEELYFFGGYDDAERKMLFFLPDYLDSAFFYEPDSPLVCLHAQFFDGDTPTHRDFLGALIGAGISRESIGDICIGTGSCDFFVTREIAPFVLQNLISAGRTRLHLSQASLAELSLPEPQTKEIRDTVASLRLDSVISSGFRIGRSLAAKYVETGKAAINGLPCEKADKPVRQDDKISVRGLGKILLRTVNGETKKGRISIVIDKYL